MYEKNIHHPLSFLNTKVEAIFKRAAGVLISPPLIFLISFPKFD